MSSSPIFSSNSRPESKAVAGCLTIILGIALIALFLAGIATALLWAVTIVLTDGPSFWPFLMAVTAIFALVWAASRGRK